MYYLKYNNIDLTQLVKVREVNLPSLPSIEHNEVEMWDMDGNIFSSLSYGNKEITIRAIIQPLNPDELDIYVNDVKRAFYVREPKALFLGDETRYLLAVPEGDVEIVELGKGTCEITVNLVAYSPYWIDVDVANITGEGKSAVIYNGGDVPTTPIFQVGIQGPTTFIQIEKVNTKERILIGELPRSQKVTVPANENVLLDECQTTGGWTQSSAALDTGCSAGGTLAITEDGGGICIGDFGNGSGTWKGACYRRNLDRTVKDFKVTCNLSFNSVGINGDPTKVEYVDFGKDDLDQISGGTLYYTYEVPLTSDWVDVRKGPGTNYGLITTMPPGTTVQDGAIKYGYLEHRRTGTLGYTSLKDLEKVAHDSRWTTRICNFVVNKATALRQEANEWSPAYYTVPAGTIVRCHVEDEGEGVKYKKMYNNYASPYRIGYIKSEDVTRATEAGYEVVYPATGEGADDKEGIIQLYGYSSSGVQLFSLSLIDDSEWYEATYPRVRRNGQDFLEDRNFNMPDPKKELDKSGSTVKYEYVASGEYGKWNDFDGEMYIERVDNVWYAYVRKSGVGLLQSSKVRDTTNSDQDLSYLVLYIGTNNPDRASAMSINEIRVQTATDIQPATQNIQHFDVGDILEIDCGVPSVKLNGRERNDLVDIGSQFFGLEVGHNELKIASDGEVNYCALFNKKYL